MLPRVSLVKSNDAEYLLFSTGDLISNALFRTGKWADHLIRISSLLLRDETEPLVLDIGANLGAFMIPLARIIDSVGGKLIGFEPQRIVYYQLCGNIVLNRLENCRVFNQAVGHYEGVIEIPEIDYSTNGNIGAFSIEKEYRQREGIENSIRIQTCEVQMLTLDSLRLEKSPALIKIDVEGYEANVLRGGLDFFRRHEYPPVLFEAWAGEWFDKRRNELFDLFISMGYQIFSISGFDYLAQHSIRGAALSFTKVQDGRINISKSA